MSEDLRKKLDDLHQAIEDQKVMSANSLIEQLTQEIELEDVTSVEARMLFELMEKYDEMMERLYEEDEILSSDFDRDEGEWY